MSITQDRIRRFADTKPDGFTHIDAWRADPKSRGKSVVLADLHDMPDAHIDRWAPYRAGFIPMWVVVKAPDDCPPPEGYTPPASYGT